MGPIPTHKPGPHGTRIPLCQVAHCPNEAEGVLLKFIIGGLEWALNEGANVCTGHNINPQYIQIVWKKEPCKKCGAPLTPGGLVDMPECGKELARHWLTHLAHIFQDDTNGIQAPFKSKIKMWPPMVEERIRHWDAWLMKNTAWTGVTTLTSWDIRKREQGEFTEARNTVSADVARLYINVERLKSWLEGNSWNNLTGELGDMEENMGDMEKNIGRIKTIQDAALNSKIPEPYYGKCYWCAKPLKEAQINFCSDTCQDSAAADLMKWVNQ